MDSEKNARAQANLRMYVNDMLAVERDLIDAVAGQMEDAHVKAEPDIQALITEIFADAVAREERLRELTTTLGGEVGAVFKEAFAAAAGTLAGIYGSFRKHPISRMLRDDHVALNLTAVAYGMLHTTALAYNQTEVAGTALLHLQTLPGQIIRLGHLIPDAVVKELAAEYPHTQLDVIDVARQNIHNAWMNANPDDGL